MRDLSIRQTTYKKIQNSPRQIRFTPAHHSLIAVLTFRHFMKDEMTEEGADAKRCHVVSHAAKAPCARFRGAWNAWKRRRRACYVLIQWLARKALAVAYIGGVTPR
jgi:hypothetical protein